MVGPYVVFDLGGTNVRIGVSHDGTNLDASQIMPTPPVFEDGVGAIEKAAREMLDGAAPLAIVGGIGWALDETKSSIRNSTKKNLADWSGKPLKDELGKRLGAPVRLENDVALVGLGEAYVGGGVGSTILVYYTVSTGVNGVRIVEGKIDRATYGFETGKQIISQGRLEELVSGTAVQKKFGIHPKELDSLDERNKLADLLAEGLYNTCLHWSPDRIVLGGSMIIGVNPIPLARTQESLAKLLTVYPSVPELRMATLGDEGGLHGARILAQSQ